MSDNNRKRIPAQIERELWARAAGRCEFRGCNICLYRDRITQQHRNTSNIAHIISCQPTGPRGNPVDSPRLATDISNLMLTCPIHNNLIDDPQYVDQYPVELLRQMKKEHEERVFLLTGLGEDYSVRVIELVSNIQGQIPVIDPRDEIKALLPFYPLEEPIRIDLSNIESIDDAMQFIDQRMSLFMGDQDKHRSYAVFILAKIPYSCYLGYVIGDKRKVKSFHHFRDTGDWKWQKGGAHIHTVFPEVTEHSDVNLLINISGVVQEDLIPRYPTYIIQADAPGVCFLKSEDQVAEFRVKYREALDEIRYHHGEQVNIHLFVAAPNPITFEIGRSIMKNLDPTIILYDKVVDDSQYKKIMTLHKRIREI